MATDPTPPSPATLDPSIFDAYAPAEIARSVQLTAMTKAKLAMTPLLGLSALAGAFISFGAMFYTLVLTGAGPEFGPPRLLAGIAFSLGLVLVLVGGAELFTGNSLMVMGWADRKVTTRDLLRNWIASYVGNFAGAIGIVAMATVAGVIHLGDDGVGFSAVKIAAGKVELPFHVAFVRGVLCNVLVCLAVWLCLAAHSVTAKILAIVFPISAFVALGFEHSIANMYLIPMGILAAADANIAAAAAAEGIELAGLGVRGFMANLIPVTLGNIVGGGGLVALTYYVIYLRGDHGGAGSS
ncbi:MAG: formate/nitrite transporter family protein [Rhodospirillales bacterium]|jgi:formate/nitrite transporter|nr:formate/nitrite transporter family protein [Rhodospirillales bacterium]